MRNDIKILEVEDEAIIAMQMQFDLRKMGYGSITHAPNGERAIESVRKNRPDLILMDILLPGKMDGIDTAERIRSELDIPVIYITGYNDPSITARASRTEPIGFFVKPVEMERLKSLIDSHFRIG